MHHVTRRRVLCGAALLAAAPTIPQPAHAQAAPWPTRPVRIVVPFPAGGTTDLLGRILAAQLQQRLGSPFVVDNRGGARDEPDGHTLLMATIGTAAINYELYKATITYKPADLAAVSNMVNVPNVILVASDSPSRTLQDLVARARATPGGLTIGSSGNGSSLHLTGELLKEAAAINLVHVPYRGAGPMLIDAIAGRVDLSVDNLPSSIGHIRGGRLRALAVTGAQRSPSLPDVPTVREAGLPGVETVAWFGLQAPARTPRPIIDRLAAEMRAVVSAPEVQSRIAELGGDGAAGTPEEFQRLIDAEILRWTDVIRRAKVQVD